MTYNIKVKRTFGDTEIIIETTIDDKEEASGKLKELHELIQASIKELFPASNKQNAPYQPFPTFGIKSPRSD